MYILWTFSPIIIQLFYNYELSLHKSQIDILTYITVRQLYILELISTYNIQ